MRQKPWPDSYRFEPSIAKEDVVKAIKGLRWNPEQWQALRVAANLTDPRSETPESYVAFLKRSKAQFWSPENVLFWLLVVTTQRFHQDSAPGPASF